MFSQHRTQGVALLQPTTTHSCRCGKDGRRAQHGDFDLPGSVLGSGTSWNMRAGTTVSSIRPDGAHMVRRPSKRARSRTHGGGHPTNVAVLSNF
ncbi:hypothetical protein HPB50_014496 [Hyalomma asiaticum]|uniref:Uncharacterized protein n=1 Tax=Hyalomma asiaticum TaxID=266040 RepID=A0ACB7SH45_HYAAI|nr:hypothetical protein HPB50_014496 [Hyalomma asiaticum]